MSGSQSVLAYLCQTTKRANKFCATNIAKQQTQQLQIKLKSSSHKTFYKNDIYIFVALNHGYTATQNIMQKMMASLNLLSFVKECLL